MNADGEPDARPDRAQIPRPVDLGGVLCRQHAQSVRQPGISRSLDDIVEVTNEGVIGQMTMGIDH
jgi:hypothetical protein